MTIFFIGYDDSYKPAIPPTTLEKCLPYTLAALAPVSEESCVHVRAQLALVMREDCRLRGHTYQSGPAQWAARSRLG